MDVFDIASSVLNIAKIIISFEDIVKSTLSVDDTLRRDYETILNLARLIHVEGIVIRRWAISTNSAHSLNAEHLKTLRYSLKHTKEALCVARVQVEERIEACTRSTGGAIFHFNHLLNIHGTLRHMVTGRHIVKDAIANLAQQQTTLHQAVYAFKLLLHTSLYTTNRALLTRTWELYQKAETKYMAAFSKTEGVPRSIQEQGVHFVDYDVDGDIAYGLENEDIYVKRYTPEALGITDANILKDESVNKDKLVMMLEAMGQASQRPGRKKGEVDFLKCVGYTQTTGSTGDAYYRLKFQLRAGSGYSPKHSKTLRTKLLEGMQDNTLNDRVQLAVSVSSALALSQSLMIVHKFLSPDAILMLSDAQKGDIGSPCLLAFGEARHEKVESGKLNVDAKNFLRKFYCHPDHHIQTRNRAFRMKDDIFSLGLILIEIGLGKSFFQRKGLALVLADWVEEYPFSDNEGVKGVGVPVDRRKRVHRLIEIAEKELPKVMGQKYAEAVIVCLKLATANGEIHYQEKQSQESDADPINDMDGCLPSSGSSLPPRGSTPRSNLNPSKESEAKVKGNKELKEVQKTNRFLFWKKKDSHTHTKYDIEKVVDEKSSTTSTSSTCVNSVNGFHDAKANTSSEDISPHEAFPREILTMDVLDILEAIQLHI